MATDTRHSDAADTVVLIHGLWMTPLCWEHWIMRYSALGYRVLAPAWPGMKGEIPQLRRDPSAYAGLGVTEIADHYERIVRGLERPPIIMGHSFGGLVTQLLLDRGVGAAGVAIDSAQPKGVLALPFSTLRSGWPVLRNPANARRTVMLTEAQFHYAFTNTLDKQESLQVYARQAIPGPGRPLFQAAFAGFNARAATAVNARNNHRAPLLLIGGGKDHIVPPAITRSNFKLYRQSRAITEYKEYPGRSHFTIGQRGWETLADDALTWATGHTARHPSPEQPPQQGTIAASYGTDHRDSGRVA